MAGCFGASKFVEKCQYRERAIDRTGVQKFNGTPRILISFDRDVYRVIRDTSVDLNWKIPSYSESVDAYL